MTTANTSASSKTPQAPGRFRLPDIPQREPDEVTQFDHIAKTGNAHYLAQHLGNPETTLVEADRWIAPDTDFDKRRARYPDLLVAFGVDPEAYRASNGYVVEEQGKAPDFVLEVATLMALAYGTRVEDANDRGIAPGNLRAPSKALAPSRRDPRIRPARAVGVFRHGVNWLRRLMLKGRLWSRVWLLPEPWPEPKTGLEITHHAPL